MNLAWEVALKAIEQELDLQTMRFCPNFNSSPYRETAFEDLNLAELSDPHIELNPLYRFSPIFSALFHANVTGYEQLSEMLFDLFMHYQTQLDLRRGLTRSEYYIRAILRDLMDGVYGESAAQAIMMFRKDEVKAILYRMLNLFQCGCLVSSFMQLMGTIYPTAIVYRNRDKDREILIYLPVDNSVIEQQKINFVLGMFLPMNYTVYVFWNRHFGLIDMDETMLLDHVILF